MKSGKRGSRVLYRSRQPVRQARVLRWIVLVMAVVCVPSPFDLDLWSTATLVPNVGLVALALALVIAGEVYGRCVPVLISVDGRGRQRELVIDTVGLFGSRRERRCSQQVLEHRLLSSNLGGSHTPDMTLLRLVDRRLPLLIDSRAELDATARLPIRRI